MAEVSESFPPTVLYLVYRLPSAALRVRVHPGALALSARFPRSLVFPKRTRTRTANPIV